MFSTKTGNRSLICFTVAEILTKNRIKNLEKLLDSIVLNSLQPNFVSIVSSGESVTDPINEYNKKINVIHKHVTMSGQVYQRNIGIKALPNNIDLIALQSFDVIFPDMISCDNSSLASSNVYVLRLVPVAVGVVVVVLLVWGVVLKLSPDDDVGFGVVASPAGTEDGCCCGGGSCLSIVMKEVI